MFSRAGLLGKKKEFADGVYGGVAERLFYPSREVISSDSEDDKVERVNRLLASDESLDLRELELEYNVAQPDLDTDEAGSESNLTPDPSMIEGLDEQIHDDVGSTLAYDEEDNYDRTFLTLSFDDAAELLMIKIWDYGDMYVYDFPVIVGDDDGEGSDEVDEELETPVLQKHYNSGAAMYVYDLYTLWCGFWLIVLFSGIMLCLRIDCDIPILWYC